VHAKAYSFLVCMLKVYLAYTQERLHQSCSFWPRYAPNRLSAAASPQTPLGELIALPRPPSWFRGWDWDPPGRGRERGWKGRGGVGGSGTRPPWTGRKGRKWREGWGGRVEKGEGKEGEGRERK